VGFDGKGINIVLCEGRKIDLGGRLGGGKKCQKIQGREGRSQVWGEKGGHEKVMGSPARQVEGRVKRKPQVGPLTIACGKEGTMAAGSFVANSSEEG